jgi:hypothetical protein
VHEGQEEQYRKVHTDHMVPGKVRESSGEAELSGQWPKILNKLAKLKESHQARVYSDLMMAMQEAGPL